MLLTYSAEIQNGRNSAETKLNNFCFSLQRHIFQVQLNSYLLIGIFKKLLNEFNSNNETEIPGFISVNCYIRQIKKLNLLQTN